MFCGKCGANIKNSNLFCTKCGTKIDLLDDSEEYSVLEEKSIYKFEKVNISDISDIIYDELWIDVKFGVFCLVGSNKTYNYQLEYESYDITYNIEGNEIDIFCMSKYSQKKFHLFMIRINKENQLNAICTILNKMGNGYYKIKFQWQYAFNAMLAIWEQTKDERVTFERYFFDGNKNISDIKFSVRYIQYDNFKGFLYNDEAKILMSVRNDGKVTTYNELMFADNDQNEIIFEIGLAVEDVKTTMKLKELQYIYLNIEVASVFIGRRYEYAQFMFGSKSEAQIFFNILAILETTNDCHNMLDIPWPFESFVK